ncbi:MAG: hypothetical protein ACREEW_10385 [Caulobacteraceae bacterium]
MSEHTQSALKRLWSPIRVRGDDQLMVFWRVRLIHLAVTLSGLVLVPVFFLAALFLHSRGLGGAGIFLLASYLASYAVVEAFRIRLTLHTGRWTGWKREPIWRHEKPVRYWTWTALHVVILAIYAGWSAILFCVLIEVVKN